MNRNSMNQDYRETLNDIFKYNGVKGVVQYFTEHEKMSKDDAELKAFDLGFYALTPVSETINDIDVIDDETLTQFSDELKSISALERVSFIKGFLSKLKSIVRTKSEPKNEQPILVAEDKLPELPTDEEIIKDISFDNIEGKHIDDTVCTLEDCPEKEPHFHTGLNEGDIEKI